jgi:5-methylcytosine-specific restriction endonuclease McrA
VLDRVLDVFIAQAEKRKWAATDRPRRPRASAPVAAAKGARTIPARVKRDVWQRDGARCAFVSAQGRRCASRTRLEFDHVDPVARGGTARLDRVRLLCRAHNQSEAERVFGRPFIGQRRERARRLAGATRPGTSSSARDPRGTSVTAAAPG